MKSRIKALFAFTSSKGFIHWVPENIHQGFLMNIYKHNNLIVQKLVVLV